MPSATAGEKPPRRQDDLDNYNVDDDSDDPFKTPPPESTAQKRKATDALNVDQELDLTKKSRAPRVKLDEDRLLSNAGIPELRRRAKQLKLKGKGHEFTDAARMLSFYQLWLDDLFPKARFLDALAMVEKIGHKKRITVARGEWIEEGRPRVGGDTAEDDDFVPPAPDAAPNQATLTERPKTPTPANRSTAAAADDIPDDDDLYGATPVRNRTADAVPEDDDLDAMMAAAEAHDQEQRSRPALSNNNPPQPKAQPENEPDEDDLDALMAESEAVDKSSGAVKGRDRPPDDEEDYLFGLMREAEDHDAGR